MSLGGGVEAVHVSSCLIFNLLTYTSSVLCICIYAAVSSGSFSVAHVALMVLSFVTYARGPILAPCVVTLAHLAMSLVVRAFPSPCPSFSSTFAHGRRIFNLSAMQWSVRCFCRATDDGQRVGLPLGDSDHASARIDHRCCCWLLGGSSHQE